jgi:hypothetical protein
MRSLRRSRRNFCREIVRVRLIVWPTPSSPIGRSVATGPGARTLTVRAALKGPNCQVIAISGHAMLAELRPHGAAERLFGQDQLTIELRFQRLRRRTSGQHQPLSLTLLQTGGLPDGCCPPPTPPSTRSTEGAKEPWRHNSHRIGQQLGQASGCARYGAAPRRIRQQLPRHLDRQENIHARRLVLLKPAARRRRAAQVCLSKSI